ncbi:MAG: 4Fe-4S dicluster domain-containing protein [Planctomycetota bacterium]
MITEIKKSGKEEQNTTRREFLKKLLEVGGVAAGVYAISTFPGCATASKGVAGKYTGKQYGMVIDTRKCINCKSCTVACKAENNTPPNMFYTIVLEEKDEETGRITFFTKPCFHCSKPPCVPVCPVSATHKRPEDGIVYIDYDECIGCGLCIEACPYGSRFKDYGYEYNIEKSIKNKYDLPSLEYNEYRPNRGDKSPVGKARKCTFCVHLQNEKGEYRDLPACVKTCVGKALNFGNLADSQDPIHKLFEGRKYIRLKEEAGTEPNVYYLI